MAGGLYEHGYGEEWNDVLVYYKEGYTTSVANYHAHEFYEVNLIYSGNIRILLSNQSVETNYSHLVLTGPGVPHFISCEPDTLYRRLYLCFSPEILGRAGPEREKLRRRFLGKGSAIGISDAQRDLCEKVIEEIGRETDPLRRRLLTLYLLSHIAEFDSREQAVTSPVPPCVIGALTYIHENYARRIVAEDLAKHLHIGRTTLMMAFKKHTGSTLNEYILSVRVRHAERFLRRGKTVQETADLCGFADAGGLIRAFRKHTGSTPGQFLRIEPTK